jgi:hypothetical protein
VVASSLGTSGVQDLAATDFINPMSIGEILFKRQIAEAKYEDCKHGLYAKTTPSPDNRPLFQAVCSVGHSDKVSCVVLVDSGATSSFIDKTFPHKNCFDLQFLDEKISCRLLMVQFHPQAKYPTLSPAIFPSPNPLEAIS